MDERTQDAYDFHRCWTGLRSVEGTLHNPPANPCCNNTIIGSLCQEDSENRMIPKAFQSKPVGLFIHDPRAQGKFFLQRIYPFAIFPLTE
jgi:hypothetical protein